MPLGASMPSGDRRRRSAKTMDGEANPTSVGGFDSDNEEEWLAAAVGLDKGDDATFFDDPSAGEALGEDEPDAKTQNLVEEALQDDYYALLNVDRDATTDEIRLAYKNFARVFHPDRHRSAADAEEAKRQFTRVTTAYEILCDKNKRALYDKYGHKGLLSGWELTTRDYSPEQLREQFEKLRIRARQMAAIRAVHSQNRINVELELDEIVRSIKEGEVPVLPKLNASQSFHTQLSNRTGVTLSSRLGSTMTAHSDQPVGSGGVSIKLDHAIGHDRYVSGMVDFNQHGVTGQASVSMPLNDKDKVQLLTSTSSIDGAQAIVTLSRQFSENFVGHVSVVNGIQKIQATASYAGENYKVSATLEAANMEHTSIGAMSTKLKYKLSEKSSLKTELHYNPLLGLPGASATLTRRMSRMSKSGVGVSYSPMFGLFVNLHYTRISNHLTIPILISHQPNQNDFLAAIAIPTVAVGLAQALIINPLEARKRQRKLENNRRAMAEVVRQKRIEAASAVRLMGATVARKRRQEEARNGLIIIEAVYGVFSDNEKDNQNAHAPPPETAGRSLLVDVTISLQYHTEESRLHLRESSKSNLLGMYDPAPGEEKRLRIDYKFKGKFHSVTVDDDEAVSLPKRSHLVRDA